MDSNARRAYILSQMNVNPPSHRQLSCTAALCLLLGMASFSSASGADLGVAPIYRAPSPVANWTGSYIGIAGGGAWGSSVVHNDFTGADQTPQFDLKGGIIGITSGFNVQNGGIVYGYEGDTAITSKRGSAFAFPPNGAFSSEVREPWLSTFRGRLGFTQNNWLVYATGGAALGSVETSVAGPPGQASEKHWHWGWTVGGGVEMRLTQDWTAKVEYLYVNLQDKSYFNPAPSPVFPSNQRVSLDDHIVRVGVNYKLPWGILDSFFKR
jgi:outer membrane immunogenic protein